MTRQHKKDYISIIYDNSRTPKTDYPSKLIDYLINRFKLTKGEKILELGCGRCEFLNEFNELGFDCYGLDREQSSVNNQYGLDVLQCDIAFNKFPFENDTFEIIYHKSVIEHMYDPSNLMNETFRVLKPNGKLIILTPDWHSQWKNFYEDFTHSRPFDEMALKDLLIINGYENILIEKFYQLPLLWKMPIMKIFSSILRFFMSVYFARWLSERTGLKFFRWSVELMILGYAEKGK